MEQLLEKVLDAIQVLADNNNMKIVKGKTCGQEYIIYINVYGNNINIEETEKL